MLQFKAIGLANKSIHRKYARKLKKKKIRDCIRSYLKIITSRGEN